MQDTLTFANLPAGTTYISVTYTLDGELSSISGAGASVLLWNGVADSTGSAVAYIPLDNDNGDGTELGGTNINGWTSYTLSDSDLNDIVFTGIFPVDSTHPTLSFSDPLGVSCGFGGTCDYLNASAIRIGSLRRA